MKEIQINMPPEVRLIIQTLYEHGYEAYAVGGCVRDALLGREAHDWDITTSAQPPEVKALFRRTIDTGLQHGTVTIMIDHVGYEVTTYRIDGEYEDARHPKEVIFTSDLLEDLKRRDFTINAMAYNDKEGLVDAFDGIGDLKRRVIRCVGEPRERFSEDALRMLRAVRFAAQLGFTIDPGTGEAIRELAPTIAKVSAERIQAEMIKLLTSPHPEEIRTAWEMGLTNVFFPEWEPMMTTEQNCRHHDSTVGEHTIRTLMDVEPDKVLRLTMLLHDIAKPLMRRTDEFGQDHFKGHPAKGAEMAEVILRRWKLDNDTIKSVTALIRIHDDRPELTEKAIRRAIHRMGIEQFPAVFSVKRADIAGQSDYRKQEKYRQLKEFIQLYEGILQQKQCVTKKELAVNGRDLIAMGIKPGKDMGLMLDRLFDLVLEDPQLNDKEQLLTIVKKWLAS